VRVGVVVDVAMMDGVCVGIMLAFGSVPFVVTSHEI
jgi:hypothetical protein